jgi:hypothetical protein
VKAHPECAEFVDLSAPAWLQLGIGDRTVFDLSARFHGPVNHIEQACGELMAGKVLGLGSPTKQKPKADVAFETTFGALEVCTVTGSLIEHELDQDEIVILLDHAERPGFDFALLVLIQEDHRGGQVLGGIGLDELLQAPVVSLGGRTAHITTTLKSPDELLRR